MMQDTGIRIQDRGYRMQHAELSGSCILYPASHNLYL